MKEKQIINDFKNHKIIVDVEYERTKYYNFNNDWLGTFYLKRNEFDISVLLYRNLSRHLNNQDEMNEFIKLVIEKMIGRLLMKLHDR